MSDSIIICLMGPTAAGKTDIAIEWVQQYPMEIISVDSALVYRDMDIGTAKPEKEILEIAPHRLINIISPEAAYSVADFLVDVEQHIAEIQSKGKIPLLVGGTMMYFNALQNGLSSLPSSAPEIRQRFLQAAEQQGVAALHHQLTNVDPASAQRINENDKQRIIRALEVFEQTGQTLTQWQQNKPTASPHKFINIAVGMDDRGLLHKRIALRFEHMLQTGFIEELEVLQQRYTLHDALPSMRAVGYRQVWQYLQGKLNHEQLLEQGIAATRQLAKRQITWLRRWKNLQSPDSITHLQL